MESPKVVQVQERFDPEAQMIYDMTVSQSLCFASLQMLALFLVGFLCLIGV